MRPLPPGWLERREVLAWDYAAALYDLEQLRRVRRAKLRREIEEAGRALVGKLHVGDDDD